MGCGTGGCSNCGVSEKRGCGVSSVFDWLYQIEGPKTDNTNLVEVQFKGDRKNFYVNTKNIDLHHGDIVAVEGEISLDVGDELMMQIYLIDWLNLALKLLHVIAGIAWIGASFYFNWLENKLDRLNNRD